MKSNYNFYEAAKNKAILEIHKNLKKHIRYNEKFDNTGEVRFKYEAMYHREVAEKIAAD